MAAFEEAICEVVRNYDDRLTLKTEQKTILQCLWQGGQDVIASLPTGFGKSLVFHLCTELLRRKPGVSDNATTVVVSPLNVIQKDQMNILRERGINCCRLDMSGEMSTNCDSSDHVRIVYIIKPLKDM